MNAQEAIERIEKRIVWLKNKLGRLNGIVTHSEEINEIKNEIDALSIVLESARLLHELLKSARLEVPYERASHLPDIELDSQGYSNDFYIVLSEKAYKSIGIR